MRFALRLVSVTVAGTLMLISALAVTRLLGLTLPFETKTIDRSQPALLKSIQDISQFHAAVGNFEVVVDLEKDVKGLPDFIAGERSLSVAAGTVNAYIDFSNINDEDITLSKDGKSVNIRLPEAELDKPNLDPDRTYLFSQKRGVINRLGDAISSQDQSELYKLAETKLAAAAKESELTQHADKNTKAMLVGMFGSLDMNVTFANNTQER